VSRDYTPTEVDRALSAAVFTGGNWTRAHELLVSYGDKAPSRDAIRQWATEKHADRYHELREELAPQVAKKVAAEAEALAFKLSEAEDLLAEQLIAAAQRGELPAKEISGALRNVSTSKALQMDKLSGPVRGRPTVIHGHADPSELLERLARKVGIAQNDRTPALGEGSGPA
jgi:hypothetical protein